MLEEGLSKIPSVVAKRCALKEHITTHVKGLGWKEYHTPWSYQGRLRSLECLKEHLIFIINHSQENNKPIASPIMKITTRKTMPSLGEATVDKREKEEADESTLNELQSQSQSLRLSMIAEGKRDEMKMM